MDPDLNKYDLDHRVAIIPKMSDAEWEEAYRAAWSSYYTPDHIRTILRRVAANPRGRPKTTLSTILWFNLMIMFEGVHPLEGGGFRISCGVTAATACRAKARSSSIRATPRRSRSRHGRILVGLSTGQGDTQGGVGGTRSMDIAIAPPNVSEFESLALYHETTGGEAALTRKRRDDTIRARLRACSISSPTDEPAHAD